MEQSPFSPMGENPISPCGCKIEEMNFGLDDTKTNNDFLQIN
jgi:hypothetical protein